MSKGEEAERKESEGVWQEGEEEWEDGTDNTHMQTHLDTLIFRSRVAKIHLIPWKLRGRE